MDELIQLINKLHDTSTQLGLDIKFGLPQIAVVGGQSSGKSSVLESFVGKDFLPRGDGIVTRRPLLLQLVHHNEEFANFSHHPGKSFQISEVRAEIEKETDRETGNNKGISTKPINLKIYSPSVVNLTLIDLPGIARNPVGDQPEDIDKQITDMVMSYIEHDNCLILAVSAGNQDLATSDALNIARKADPHGLRTFGVITKLDIMDKGTDARNILLNNVIPLRHGYTGVVNRSQEDIKFNKSIDDTIEDELKFFKTNENYRDIASQQGSQHLQKMLNNELKRHIKSCLPNLRKKIIEKRRELASVVDEQKMQLKNNNKENIMTDLLEAFQREFSTAIYGKDADLIRQNEVIGGALIKKLIINRYEEKIASKTISSNDCKKKIKNVLQNCYGINIEIFTPREGLESIVRDQIRQYRDPSLECVDDVAFEVDNIIEECATKMSKFPNLRQFVENSVGEFVQDSRMKAKKRLSMWCDVQQTYLYTSHEDFKDIAKKYRISFSEEQSKNEQLKNFSEMLSEGTHNIIRQGWLNMISNHSKKNKPSKIWVILYDNRISFYKDDTTAQIIQEHNLSDLEFGDGLGSMSISITASNGKIELVPENAEVLTGWKNAFNDVSKCSEKNYTSSSESPRSHYSNALSLNEYTNSTSEIDIIYEMFDSYNTIMKKTFRDYIPKLIAHTLIGGTKEFLSTKLKYKVFKSSEKNASLMEVAAGEESKLENFQRSYEACKSAIKLIDEVY